MRIPKKNSNYLIAFSDHISIPVKMFSRILFVLFVWSLSNCCASHLDDKSRLLVVVMDGFHWNYLENAKKDGYNTPNFDQLIRTGGKAESLKPAFVSTTFPNLWTLVTGLTVEHHGMVHDRFFDHSMNRTFEGDSTPFTEFYDNGTVSDGVEPIWITNQNAGRERKSAVSVWPGGRVIIEGDRAFYTQHTEYTIRWQDRVDFIIDKINSNTAGANLGMLYFEQPGKPDIRHIESFHSYNIH